MRGWGCAREGAAGRAPHHPPEPLSCGLGDVQFSVASDDNSEFWLSPNESPAGAQLVAFVGKVPLTPQPSHPSPSTHTPICLHWASSASVTCLLQLLRDGDWMRLVPPRRG